MNIPVCAIWITQGRRLVLRLIGLWVLVECFEQQTSEIALSLALLSSKAAKSKYLALIVDASSSRNTLVAKMAKFTISPIAI